VLATVGEHEMEGSQHLAALPRGGSRSRLADALDWLGARTTTTPGKLSIVLAGLIGAILVFGIAATAAERSRAHAASGVHGQIEPLLVQAVTLYSALSDANATATTTFLKGGLEPNARRTQYLRDLQAASAALTTLSREAGSVPGARASLETITEQLPNYSGLVEAARTNNRQGFPVGAAYLRQASALLATSILPAAAALYSTEADRLSNDYGTGTATSSFVLLLVVAAIALCGLIVSQLYLARLSHRVLNVPLVVASVVVVAATAWAAAALLSERSSLLTAQHSGSDPVEVLSAARVLVSRAQSDESLALVNRGSDETDPVDFTHVMAALSGPRGLIAEGERLSSQARGGANAGSLAADFAGYQRQTALINRLLAGGGIAQAISAALSPQATNASAALDTALDQQIGAAQKRFTHAAGDASSAVSALTIAIPALTVLALVLVVIGLRQRLEEYR
jgi:hypothetical protein